VYLVALSAVVGSVVVRRRRADAATRRQLRWLLVGASAVPVLLGAGWIAGLAGAPQRIWVPAFYVTMLVVMPVAVAVAILRYDLYDVDRLLGSSLAVFLTSIVSAGIFAGIVYLVGQQLGESSGVGVAGAAFATALCLLPTYRMIHRRVGTLFDREGTVMRARVSEFVTDVRDGRAEPEAVEAVLRSVLVDADLRLLIRLPGSADDAYVDLTGKSTPRPDGAVIPLHASGSEVAAIMLGAPSTRRTRQARELARLARLPVEVSRLRLGLQVALRDVRATQARLMVAGAEERRRLERDLHDGAQQHVVAVGMRLRSIQRGLDTGLPANAELDQAVEMIEGAVAELRRLAQGVRPGRLQDGLGPALQDLLSGSPVPVELDVENLELPEVLATTSYFVVAECVTNVYKHAQATQLSVRVAAQANALVIAISDNGVGGAPAYGLTSVRDRVAALGGSLEIDSPVAMGTTIRVELPCAS